MPLPTILTAADAPSVRAAIRSDLGVSDLPDTIVEMAFGPASQSVLYIDPNAGSWPAGSDEAKRVHDAAVLFAAAYLTATVPMVQRETFQGYSYTLAPTDSAGERADTLRELASALLSLNLGSSVMLLMRPAAIALAPGGRGDIDDTQWNGIPNYRLPPPGTWP